MASAAGRFPAAQSATRAEAAASALGWSETGTVVVVVVLAVDDVVVTVARLGEDVQPDATIDTSPRRTVALPIVPCRPIGRVLRVPAVAEPRCHRAWWQIRRGLEQVA
jgi:hypothetical protein